MRVRLRKDGAWVKLFWGRKRGRGRAADCEACPDVGGREGWLKVLGHVKERGRGFLRFIGPLVKRLRKREGPNEAIRGWAGEGVG